MSIKNTIDETLNKPMNRKDFLGHVGAVFLAVIGVTSVLHSLGLHEANPSAQTAGSSQGTGYGSSAYGV